VSAYVTAVDILPPDDIVRIVDQYRRVHARHLFARVPVHLTLSCPFVPFDRLHPAEETLRSVCAEVPPFAVRVAASGSLEDPRRLVLFVEPEDRVSDLRMLLLGRFPRAEAEGLPGGLVRPHITVGYVKSAELLCRLGAELDAQAAGLSFTVDQVHVTYGNETCVWRVASVIPLGARARD
jgi:2'-5' RNA ligase